MPGKCYSQFQPTNYVNPFIGTGGHGHTFPGATVPFGMVQLSPDTRLEGWDGCGGYHYSDNYIYGFSHTHLSGTGIPDYGDILFMPFTGEDHWNNGSDGNPGYRSKFSHSDETAAPGYYRVKLEDDNINAELTATARAGFHSYLFQNGVEEKVLIDLAHRDLVLDSWIKLVNDHEIEGYRESSSWAEDQKVYFVAKFSKKINTSLFALEDDLVNKEGLTRGKNVKAILYFGKGNSEPLLIKVGISAISAENARMNLDAEIPDWDFEKTKSNANALWNKELSKILVKSNNDELLKVFYTALYHTMISPNLYSDVNGSYLGRDLQEHKTDHDYYTVFSLWDTYRAFHPLMTIIDQKRTNDFIRTFINQYLEGGLLPVWELSSNETWCMIGYHAVPVIADAYLKGIRDYDTEVAFKAMLASANKDNAGLKYYKKYGFIPANMESESVSKTLEYAYDDWCIAAVADKMNHPDVSNQFMLRAQSYKNIFDKESGFMRARYNGSWFLPFDPREVNFNYTEANSWQYSFYVPHDMQNFIAMHGGKDALASKLDALFTAPTATTGRDQSDITGLIGQYAHGNEPSHHIAYLYNFVGQPWKTQQKVDHIIKNFYKNEPDGLIGNEDCGQMSAWAVLSSMGFYSVCPGTNQYLIGKPSFDEVTINLENGKQFTINAINLSDKNIYIQSATLNGVPYTKSFIMQEDIINGGNLTLTMGNKPNKAWGSSEADIPVTAIDSQKITVAPYIGKADQLFDDSAIVDIRTSDDAEIRYTIDGSEVTDHSALYSAPFTITETTIVNFRGYKSNCVPSPVQQSVFTKRPAGINLQLLSTYAPQYSGNGENTLIDGIKGSEDYKLGGWQGYEGKDIEAIITVTNQKPVTSLQMGFLQDINAWIFMPEKIELWSSPDGKNYTFIGAVNNDIPQDKWGTIIKDFNFKFPAINDKYLKLKAVSIKNCPVGHKGFGYPAWVFSDEIKIGF
jgi:predicted alpha-1,2-mannosidase